MLMKINNTNSFRKIDPMGRIMSPKEWRNFYGIEPGDIYEFYICKDEETGEEIIGIKVNK